LISGGLVRTQEGQPPATRGIAQSVERRFHTPRQPQVRSLLPRPSFAGLAKWEGNGSWPRHEAVRSRQPVRACSSSVERRIPNPRQRGFNSFLARHNRSGRSQRTAFSLPSLVPIAWPRSRAFAFPMAQRCRPRRRYTSPLPARPSEASSSARSARKKWDATWRHWRPRSRSAFGAPQAGRPAQGPATHPSSDLVAQPRRGSKPALCCANITQYIFAEAIRSAIVLYLRGEPRGRGPPEHRLAEVCCASPRNLG
jgi:hypothetical protein